MDPMLVTYIGFVIAIFILLWGIVEIGRRYYGRRKVDTRKLNTWVPLKPNGRGIHDDPPIDMDTDEQQSVHSKAQQNGHYSQSKRKL